MRGAGRGTLAGIIDRTPQRLPLPRREARAATPVAPFARTTRRHRLRQARVAVGQEQDTLRISVRRGPGWWWWLGRAHGVQEQQNESFQGGRTASGRRTSRRAACSKAKPAFGGVHTNRCRIWRPTYGLFASTSIPACVCRREARSGKYRPEGCPAPGASLETPVRPDRRDRALPAW